MVQIYAWSIRGAQLLVINTVLGFVTLILILWWVRKYKKITREISEDDEWLKKERESMSYGKSNALRAGIANLRHMSKIKKTLSLVLVGSLIFSLSWFAWEMMPFRSYSEGVQNGDTRVFTIANVNYETNTTQVRGVHNEFLDARICILELLFPYVTGDLVKINATADVYLEGNLYADANGYAIINVGFILYSYGGTNMEDSVFWYADPQNDTVRVSSNISSSTDFYYPFDANTELYIGIRLSVGLGGNSRIEGLEVGTPAFLKVNNLTVIPYSP